MRYNTILTRLSGDGGGGSDGEVILLCLVIGDGPGGARLEEVTDIVDLCEGDAMILYKPDAPAVAVVEEALLVDVDVAENMNSGSRLGKHA